MIHWNFTSAAIPNLPSYDLVGKFKDSSGQSYYKYIYFNQFGTWVESETGDPCNKPPILWLKLTPERAFEAVKKPRLKFFSGGKMDGYGSC